MSARSSFQNCSIPVCRFAAILILSSSVASAQMVTHYAGPTAGAGSSDGIGSAASLGVLLSHLAIDGDGNIIVADPDNSTIRRVSPSGAVTTIAGLAGISGNADGNGANARFTSPVGVAIDHQGNIYVTDQTSCIIRKVTPSGTVTTLAGTAYNYGSADLSGPNASFRNVTGIAVDGSGNVYVSDIANQTIRKITPAGSVSTLAGTDLQPGSTDAVGTNAQFNNPNGVAVDASGNVYVADTFNHTIRKITTDGTVSTFAGSAGMAGFTDGTGNAARFGLPKQISIDGSGNLYVADEGNVAIRKITPAGVVTTITTFGTLRRAEGVAVDSAGNVYVANDSTISKLGIGGVATLLAGSEPVSGLVNATGANARFALPVDVAADHLGNLFVADESNHMIRKVDPDGAVTTFVGGAFGSSDGTGTGASLESPDGVTVDATNNVYFTDFSSDTVRKATPAGVVTTLAGDPAMTGSVDGTGSAALFSSPQGIAVDTIGNLYVADTGNFTIRKVDPSNLVTTLAGVAGESGSADGAGDAARFGFPRHLVIGPDGNLYVTDGSLVRVVTPGGAVTTIPVTNQGVIYPLVGIVFDAAGHLLVTEYLSSRIDQITAGEPALFPIGKYQISGQTDGEGTRARLSFIGALGMTKDDHGVVYLADSNNFCIRAIGADLGDRANIDNAGAKAGEIRHLGDVGANATDWSWSIYRQPAGSTAALSSSTIRNPTFTPDASGLYIFQLIASRGTLKSVSTISLSVSEGRAHAIRHP